MGDQKPGRSSNQAEKAMVLEAIRRVEKLVGEKIGPEQRNAIHRWISGFHYTTDELVQEILDLLWPGQYQYPD